MYCTPEQTQVRRALFNRSNDLARISDCEHGVRETPSDYAPSAYDRTRSDRDTREDDRSGTDPHIGPDGNWSAILLLTPKCGIERMKRSQDLDPRTELAVIADKDLADVKNRAIEVEVDSFAKFDVRTEIAEEGWLEPRGVAALAEELQEQLSPPFPVRLAGCIQ
jgi:hypothetical protein